MGNVRARYVKERHDTSWRPALSTHRERCGVWKCIAALTEVIMY